MRVCAHLRLKAEGDAQQGPQGRRIHMQLKQIHLASLQNALPLQAQLLGRPQRAVQDDASLRAVWVVSLGS